MRLVERNEIPEEHYTEGELDLEAPEEMALGEMDEVQLLEEELDNDDIAEEEVDEDTLELTLEDLVHHEDADTDVTEGVEGLEQFEQPSAPQEARAAGTLDTDADDLDYLDDSDVSDLEDLEDLEESLDRILADRLAGDEDAAHEDDEDDDGLDRRPLVTSFAVEVQLTDREYPGVAPCRTDEFVCARCFLVRKRAQLAESGLGVCCDCSS